MPESMSDYLARIRAEDEAHRAHKREQHAPKFVREEGKGVTVDLPIVSHRKSPGAVGSLPTVGADIPMRGTTPRPDRIVQDDKKG